MHLLVYEANHAARRFYDSLDGQVVDRHEEEAPGGARLAVLRYLWRDPAGLIGSPAASSLLG